MYSLRVWKILRRFVQPTAGILVFLLRHFCQWELVEDFYNSSAVQFSCDIYDLEYVLRVGKAA